LLLWIMNSLTPSEIRDRILKVDSTFCRALVDYLESVHTGEYLTGTQDEVLANVSKVTEKEPKTYINPIESLPQKPPSCTCLHNKHSSSCAYRIWHENYRFTVDDIISKSNIHTCSTNINKDGSKNRKKQYIGCLDNPWGKCRARFPRKLHDTTKIDYDTGTIYMKKKEEWINTFTPVLSYLFRCNTDVTSLKSGTAINSVAEYVTKYITKTSLKTYTIFEVIRSVFEQ
ncbi:hypothetical protein BDN72DRAFT_719411, partial [Pluteus cervinus]